MIPFAIFTSILLLALWVWLAYEYKIAIPLSAEEELSFEEEFSSNINQVTIQETP